MANEPASVSSSPPATPPPARHVRTFAQDVARLSGKPAPVIAPAPPVKPVPEPPVPKVSPVPIQEKRAPEITKAPPPKTPAPPAPEPPPARIIPKAPNSNETREAVLARLRARQVPEVPTATPVPVPKAPSTNETREDVLARLRAKAEVTARAEEIKLPEKQTPAPAPKKESALPPLPKKIAPLNTPPAGPDRIHTYKSDFADHAQSQDASTLSVIAAEADAGRTARVIFKEKKPFPLGALVSVLFILAGGGALFFAYYTISNQPPSFFPLRVPALIASDERRELVTQNLLSELSEVGKEPLPEGNVRVVYTTIATTTESGVLRSLPQNGGALISALALPMPDILARSIREESTVGIIRAGEEQAVFFILRVDSFERSFAGMLEWESRIASDLALLYEPYPLETESSSTTTAPVEATIANSLTSGFKDEVVQNRDVRVLRDEEGRAVLLYGFRDKETLIIARNEASYLSLVERMNISRGW